jgi:hypothetical protein
MTQAEIGELLSDQVYSFLNDLKAQRRAAIEPDCWDDEEASGLLALDRWADRRFAA